jgi:hypothetical protein
MIDHLSNRYDNDHHLTDQHGRLAMIEPHQWEAGRYGNGQ